METGNNTGSLESNTTGTISGDLDKAKQKARFQAYMDSMRINSQLNDLANLKRRVESAIFDITSRFLGLSVIIKNLHDKYDNPEHKHHLTCINKRVSKIASYYTYTEELRLLYKNAEDKNIGIGEEISYYESILKILNSLSMKLQLYRSDVCQVAYLNDEYISPDNVIHKKQNNVV